MATLTKLLAIKIVASNLLGCSRSFMSTSPPLGFSVRMVLIWGGPNEKNAISAPETSAEQIMRTNITTKPAITGKPIG